MNDDEINEVYDKITSIFYNWENWKLDDDNEENKLNSFLKIAFKKLNINIDFDNINENDQRNLFKEFIKFFDYKLLDKTDKIFNFRLKQNCIDKLWNELYKNYINKKFEDSFLFFSKYPYCKYLNNKKLKIKIDLIWDKYKNKYFIEKIIQKEKLTLDEIKEKFIDSDPTDQKIYLRWILKSFKIGKFKSIEDLKRVNTTISKILLLNKSKKLGIDILKYDNDELETIIDLNRKFFEKKEEKKREKELIKLETEYLYEGEKIRIISPKTEKSAKYYGKNTCWCTSANKNNAFEYYNKKGKLFIILIKNISSDDLSGKYQLQFETDTYRDDGNNDIQLYKIIDKYPEIKNVIKYANLYDKNENYKLYDKIQLNIIKEKNIKNVILLTKKITNLSNYDIKNLFLFNSYNNIIKLPYYLQTLVMGVKFNKPITLPNSLITLVMGYSFNQPIILSDSLQTLIMGWYFDQSIILPDSLMTLKMDNDFNQIIKVKRYLNIIFNNEKQKELVIYID